jgi:hypothetical protein
MEDRVEIDDGGGQDTAVDVAFDASDRSLDVRLLENMRALGPLAVALLAQRGAALPPAPAAAIEEPPRKPRTWQRIAVALIIAGVIGAGIWWGLAHRPLL